MEITNPIDACLFFGRVSICDSFGKEMRWRGMAYPQVTLAARDWLNFGGWSDFLTAGGRGGAQTVSVKIKAGSVMSCIVTPLISIVSVGCGG